MVSDERLLERSAAPFWRALPKRPGEPLRRAREVRFDSRESVARVLFEMGPIGRIESVISAC